MPTTDSPLNRPDPTHDPERHRAWEERQRRWMAGEDLDENEAGQRGVPPPAKEQGSC